MEQKMLRPASLILGLQLSNRREQGAGGREQRAGINKQSAKSNRQKQMKRNWDSNRFSNKGSI